MVRRNKRGRPRRPRSTAQVADCRICGRRVVWLPETTDYCARRDGPMNHQAVNADRFTSEAEHDVHGFTVDGLAISGKRVVHPEDAERLVVVYTRHHCDPVDIERHRERAEAAAKPQPAWGADRAAGED